MTITMTEDAKNFANVAFIHAGGKKASDKYKINMEMFDEAKTIEEVRELVYSIADGIDFLLKAPCMEVGARKSLITLRDAAYEYLDAAQKALGMRKN